MERISGDRVQLAETKSERDLGVIIYSKLKWNEQVYSVLGMLKRSFVHWNAQLLVKLFTTCVRPHLEYCSSVWNPYR